MLRKRARLITCLLIFVTTTAFSRVAVCEGSLDKLADYCKRTHSREALVMAFANHVRQYGEQSVPDELKQKIRSVVGEYSFKFISAMPRLERASTEEVKRALESLDQLVLDTLEEGETIKPGSPLDTQKTLAELRILLSQNFERDEVKNFVKGKLEKRFEKITATGCTLDFVTAHLTRDSYSRVMKYYLAHRFYERVTRRRDRNVDQRKSVMASLAKIEDNEKLVTECWRQYWEEGTPALCLQMAQLLHKRGLKEDGETLEDKGLVWLELFTLFVGGEWASWHSMATVNLVEGYEKQTIYYGQRAMTKGCNHDSGRYITAHAMLRKGDVNRSARMLVDGVRRKKDYGRFYSPYGVYGSTKTYAEAVVKELIKHPKISPESLALLREMFPQSTKAADGGPGLETRREKAKELDKVVTRVKDTAVAGVEWLIYEKKFVARLEKTRLRNFEVFLTARGLEHIQVRNLSFLPNSVWVATDKGTFCYDRHVGGWVEYAVNREHIGAPVDSVSVVDDNTVVFKMRINGVEKTYSLNTKTSQWK